jgi:hypothetical protein
MLSNFLSDDQHTALSIAGTNGNTNWYTGNNQLGITEVAERFSTIKSGVLSGFGGECLQWTEITGIFIERIPIPDAQHPTQRHELF